MGDVTPAPSTNAAPAPAVMPVLRDWRWVQGAVFVPTNCVNEAQEWDEYDPAINDRELHYAAFYGINCVRVYLHYAIYLKKRDALLREIDDFLTRADKYGIKVEFIFFDDCWNQPPKDILSADYKYPAPLYGVHNSRWLSCPGNAVKINFAVNEPKLKAYVQDIVNAHKADPRIAFLETYNEPAKTPATQQILKAAQGWVHETGTTIPLTATGAGVFAGAPYSDFLSWHKYGDYKPSGDFQTLCTECMNRKDQSVPGIVDHFQGKNGYIFWELGIGRDNCRFAWEHTVKDPEKEEPTVPFHGIIYPDGHPWSIDDARALMGEKAFESTPAFTVQYFRDDHFVNWAKTSITPMIDFDLDEETGTGSPDATARLPQDHYSITWTGMIAAPADGVFTFYADGDGKVKIEVDKKVIINKTAPGRSEVSQTATLAAGKRVPVRIMYSHGTGRASLHFFWSGPGLEKTAVLPAKTP